MKSSLHKTQHVPDAHFRVDTGPLKFGSDWTGVFIRGDDTDIGGLYYLKSMTAEDETAQTILNRLIGLFQSCREDNAVAKSWKKSTHPSISPD